LRYQECPLVVYYRPHGAIANDPAEWLRRRSALFRRSGEYFGLPCAFAPVACYVFHSEEQGERFGLTLGFALPAGKMIFASYAETPGHEITHDSPSIVRPQDLSVAACQLGPGDAFQRDAAISASCRRPFGRPLCGPRAFRLPAGLVSRHRVELSGRRFVQQALKRRLRPGAHENLVNAGRPPGGRGYRGGLQPVFFGPRFRLERNVGRLAEWMMIGGMLIVPDVGARQLHKVRVMPPEPLRWKLWDLWDLWDEWRLPTFLAIQKF
jgi:hypothetical protein